MTTKTEGVYRLHMVLITSDHQFTIVLTWVNYYTAFCMLPFATDAFLANRRTWNMFLKILWSSLLTKPFWYYQGKTEYLRNYELPNPRTYVSSKGYSFTKGQTGEFLANEWYRVWYIEQYKVMHDSVLVCRGTVRKDHTTEAEGWGCWGWWCNGGVITHACIRTVIFRIYVIFLSGAAGTRKEWMSLLYFLDWIQTFAEGVSDVEHYLVIVGSECRFV